ncbi:hypothetical protein P3X46_026328 [Hevea brasiliensis]|uniref:CCT domain-containing protein n=1 Tax=Hevea brasiliensis TaxID=3981 RepID=A0ABQ9KW95_HEVBR|nr:uncharacterized protein LOC110658452 [Hevea brasiliensis]KAJ9152808.1 hypothetical protein P3X46_026328 [Hevea brasiliensis]
MCSKNSPIRPRKPAKKATVSPKKSARKTRTKTRKPKYLSLKLQLSPHKKTQTPPKPTKMPHKQQLNLFPLHPENLVHDKDFHDVDQVSDHVAFLFDTATDTSTSLHGILDSTTTTTTPTTTATTTSEEGPLSPSLTYVYRGHDSEERCSGMVSSLVKAAMKCKEREASGERWVSYWEVVEKKEQEEVSSCCAAADSLEKMVQAQGEYKKGLVGLKLDYQGIMNAWSDKGPLYIKGEESPQTVPDLHEGSNWLVAGWTVPDIKSGEKLGQREASVLRYKEKRQTRLFAKRIRYQVRKLNAEKRPRLKGRFVKRNGEE